MCFFIILFFFFKQKTAYEMRISDWSSDVCSSDLNADVCNALEGHEPTIGEGHRNLCQRLQIGACHIRQADGDRKTPVTLEDHSGIASADGGGNSVLNDLGSRSEEHTSALQSLMRISYAVSCLKKKHTMTCNKDQS